jgi:hypothetical protein
LTSPNPGSQLGAELVETAEVLINRCSEGAIRLVAALRRHVGPEHRVVDVAAEMEGQILLELVDVAERIPISSLSKLVQRGVDALHVRGMVLGVM